MMEKYALSKEIEEELVNGLLSVLAGNIYKIVLYGSVARGEAGPESDVDIVIILNNSFREEEKDKFLHWNAEFDLKHDRIFSIVDVEKDVMDKWGNVVPFYRNINNEGVVLWKAA